MFSRGRVKCTFLKNITEVQIIIFCNATEVFEHTYLWGEVWDLYSDSTARVIMLNWVNSWIDSGLDSVFSVHFAGLGLIPGESEQVYSVSDRCSQSKVHRGSDSTEWEWSVCVYYQSHIMILNTHRGSGGEKLQIHRRRKNSLIS